MCIRPLHGYVPCPLPQSQLLYIAYIASVLALVPAVLENLGRIPEARLKEAGGRIPKNG